VKVYGPAGPKMTWEQRAKRPNERSVGRSVASGTMSVPNSLRVSSRAWISESENGEHEVNKSSRERTIVHQSYLF
jgi:hypothetical protein